MNNTSETGGSKYFPQPRTSVPATGATILLVEDDRAVREFVRLVLMRQGFRVLEAESDQEALWVWDRHWRNIDLLLTDLMIPTCSTGVEIAKKMRSRKTDLRVIYTSGFSIEMAGFDFFESDDTLFLQKPYTNDILLGKVRQALGENPAETAARAQSTRAVA